MSYVPPKASIDLVSQALPWFKDFLGFCWYSEINTSGAYPNGTNLNEAFNPLADVEALRKLRDSSILCFLVQAHLVEKSVEDVLDALPGYTQDLLKALGHGKVGFLAEEALSDAWQDYALPRARKLRAKKTTKFDKVFVPTSK
jgi:hypothetical protein